MIGLDSIIVSFLSENYLTATFIWQALKVIAKKTPWAADDEILQMFSPLFKRRS